MGLERIKWKVDATNSVKRKVMGCCKHGNETSDYSKKRGGIHSLADDPFSF
jgi:hypothetical protein